MTPQPKLHRFDLLDVPPEGGSLSPHAHAPDYKIDPDTGCWEWQKFRFRGYGRLSLFSKGVIAHRAYYVAATKRDITGLDIHHICENTGCVNPAHMEVVAHVSHLRDHKRSASTKYTWDEVCEIRRRYRAGEASITTLAAEYDVNPTQIFRIVINQDWFDPNYKPETRKPCEHCGEEFTHRRPTVRYCAEHRDPSSRRVAA